MAESEPTLLLVAEEPVLAEISRFRLELLGHSVTHVTNADEALASLESELPSLILIDQMQSGTDGTELLNRLSNDERTGDIPVMFMSSNADLDEVQKAYNAGADEYLVTPYDPAVLERKVHRLLIDSEASE